MGEIYSIVYQTTPSQHVEPYHYSRTALDAAELVVGHGIQGDLKGGHNPQRQLNLMSYETLEALRAEGFKTSPGEMGEQIIVRGLDVNTLAGGTRLQFGDSAVIEVVKPRTGCEWFQQVQGKSRDLVQGRMGVMAMVISGGRVHVGDAVRVLQNAAG